MKLEGNWPKGFRGEIVQRCGGTDERLQVITIAHPEHLAQVS